jgi:hypothetical protein
MFGVLFYLLFVLLISSHRCLDVLLFEKIQDYEEKTLSSSKQEERQLFLDHIDPIWFRSLVHTLACMHRLDYLILIPIGFGFYTWLDFLSPVVMSVVQVFHHLWCWVLLVLSVVSVSLPSIVMWGDRGEVRCYGLSMVWNGGDGWIPSGVVVSHARIC